MRSSGNEIAPPSRLTKPILMGSPVAGPATLVAGATVAAVVACGAVVAGAVDAGCVATGAGGTVAVGAAVWVRALLSLPHAASKSAAVLPSATTRWFFMDGPPPLARDAGR